MQILLKQVKIVDPNAPNNGEVKDVLIRDGKIESIRNRISTRGPSFQLEGTCVSPGWMDVGAFIGDPGYEHIETLETASAAARRGGYTHLVMLPNTQPIIQSKAEVEYIIRRSSSLPTSIHPIGALSVKCQGGDMAEMMDMHHAGALAFSDGKRSIQDAGLLLRSLEYVKSFGGILINQPATRGLTPDGLIDEGPVSVSLGLRGLPVLAEVMMVKRDLDLLRYSESRLHIMNISCRESMELIAAAKSEGLGVSCSVPAINLVETIDAVKTFDANYKVLPPLRSEQERKALLQGVKDGTIDFVTSNHRPVNIEGKKLEFAYADFGISSLETTYNLLSKALTNTRKWDRLVELMSIRPRQIFGLAVPTIDRDQVADMTLFHPGLSVTHTAKEWQSRSRNNPYFDRPLPGQVLGVIHKGQILLAGENA